MHALGVLEAHAGSVPAARDLLREAAGTAEGSARTWALADLALAQHRMGDVPGMRAAADVIAPDLDAPDTQRATLAAWVRGFALVQCGEPELGHPLLHSAVQRMDSEPGLRDDPRFLVLFMLGHAWLGDAHTAVASIERRIRVARERGALGVLVAALAMSAHGRAELLGDHTGAFADAGEAVALAEHLQYVADAAPAMELLAWEYAARGRHDLARDHLDRARALVDRAGTTAVAAHQALTAAFCALCRGDLAETAALLEARLAADGGVGALGEPLGVAPLLVEAWTGLGRGPEAATLTARYGAESRDPTHATAALVARCRALTATAPDEAEAAFEESLVHHGAMPDGFEVPHTRLLYGAWLRRSGRRTDARRQLAAAVSRFTAMDLTAWAERADAELRATGLTARSRQPLPVEPLTPQETRIAGLAAQGLSNRDIAAAVFLSPKTVEHHLSRVYRKRGMRSRVQLTREFPQA
jgi:DNA-binding CsgD family transcriptional regulator